VACLWITKWEGQQPLELEKTLYPFKTQRIHPQNLQKPLHILDTTSCKMRYCLSFLVVELMRMGKHPQQACEEAIGRMRLDPRNKEAAVIALNKKGEHGGASLMTFSYAVWKQGKDSYLRQVQE